MNIDLVWDDANSRGDWSVASGVLSTGNLLVAAVYLSLFTDRVAQPDYVPDDGDRRGWWHDTLAATPIGSRLWQLRRRKVASRSALSAEAHDIVLESLQWMKASGIVATLAVTIDFPPAGQGRAGTLLRFNVTLAQPGNDNTVVRALWSAV